jgi:hypothetical protein
MVMRPVSQPMMRRTPELSLNIFARRGEGAIGAATAQAGATPLVMRDGGDGGWARHVDSTHLSTPR